MVGAAVGCGVGGAVGWDVVGSPVGDALAVSVGSAVGTGVGEVGAGVGKTALAEKQLQSVLLKVVPNATRARQPSPVQASPKSAIHLKCREST